VIVSEVTETMKDGARRRGTVARDSGKWFVAKDVCQSCCGRCELMPLSEPRFRDEHGSLVQAQWLRRLGDRDGHDGLPSHNAGADSGSASPAADTHTTPSRRHSSVILKTFSSIGSDAVNGSTPVSISYRVMPNE
jgi:hypothetical protein